MTLAIEEERRTQDPLEREEPDGYERINGILVRKEMSYESNWTQGKIYARLDHFVEEGGLGWVAPEAALHCFSWAPKDFRRPDVSFISVRKSPEMPTGSVYLVPDLAVEVVSPNDTAEEVSSKVSLYQEAGVPLVWVVYPISRTALSYRLGAGVVLLHEEDELDGQDVVPGFRCRLADVLPRLSFKTAGEEE